MFKVKDYMTKNVICAEPDATISQIIDLMKEKGIHRVPVVERKTCWIDYRKYDF